MFVIGKGEVGKRNILVSIFWEIELQIFRIISKVTESHRLDLFKFKRTQTTNGFWWPHGKQRPGALLKLAMALPQPGPTVGCRVHPSPTQALSLIFILLLST